MIMIRSLSRIIIIFFSLFTSILTSTGCSKYTRYHVLNFFFDGVPHPDTLREEKLTATTKTDMFDQLQKMEPASAAKAYRHPPDEKTKDECTLCHGGKTTNMIIPPRDICLKCHSQIKESKLFIHGPTNLDCTACHEVHGSIAKTLIKKTGNFLCLDCHYTSVNADPYKAEAHKKPEGGELICLSCHDPHGGQDRYFIKNKDA